VSGVPPKTSVKTAEPLGSEAIRPPAIMYILVPGVISGPIPPSVVDVSLEYGTPPRGLRTHRLS